MQRKQTSQTGISHLIADAVSHAVARRSQVEEESLTALSDDEVRAIMGGQTSATVVVKYPVVVTAGIISVPEEVI